MAKAPRLKLLWNDATAPTRRRLLVLTPVAVHLCSHREACSANRVVCLKHLQFAMQTPHKSKENSKRKGSRRKALNVAFLISRRGDLKFRKFRRAHNNKRAATSSVKRSHPQIKNYQLIIYLCSKQLSPISLRGKNWLTTTCLPPPKEDEAFAIKN